MLNTAGKLVYTVPNENMWTIFTSSIIDAQLRVPSHGWVWSDCHENRHRDGIAASWHGGLYRRTFHLKILFATENTEFTEKKIKSFVTL